MKLFARPDSPHLRGLREENYKAKLSLNSFLVLHNFSAPGTDWDWRGLGERSPPSPSGENILLSRPLLSQLSSVISQLDILSSQFSWICSLVLKISDV